ncbi:MAG: serine/threonine-protein kinase [Leptolyngbyaceae cyanobacterium MO_188.B28]|nr:serine/threonine-protein kinase [Leptolyngbyaceae cyanobacterium MO_188.B28]
MHSTLLGGRYRIIRQFGTGGFSQTFLVEDLHLPGDPRCVIKQLVPQATDANTLEMARRLFDTEAQALYKLGGHDQIPTLLAHFEENQEFYLAQEYIEGEQLTEEFSDEEVWSEDKVIALLKELLEVLSFVHKQNVIHRDIKPSNLIRRRQDGRIVLIDFGAVKQVSNRPIESEVEAAAGATNLTIAIGTQGYMPNEQMAGKPRFSSDVYAVGMIGVRALTGVHPKKLPEDPRTSEIDWHGHVPPNVSSTLIAILDRMICYDFRARYQDATEALEALERFSPEPDMLSEEQDILSQLFLNAEQYIAEIKADNPELQAQSNFAEGTQFDLQTAPSTAITDEVNGFPQDSSASGFLQDPGGSLVQQPSVLPSGNLSKIFWERLLKPLPILAGVAILGISVGFFKVALSRIQPERRAGEVSIRFESSGPIDLPIAPLTLPPAEERAAEKLAEGDRLQAAGQHQAALVAYEQAIDLYPHMASAYLGRCNSLNALRQPDHALVACNEALALNINYPEALLGKGNALEQQGNLLEALRFYTRATRIKPTLAEAWMGQSRIFRQFGRTEEASEALNRAVTLEQAPVDSNGGVRQPSVQPNGDSTNRQSTIESTEPLDGGDAGGQTPAAP